MPSHAHHLATISLVQLGDGNRPIGYASGCIIRYRGTQFILTVAHATGNQGNWAVEIDFDLHERKARLYQLGGMGFVSAARLKKNGKFKTREVDFSYKLLRQPLAPRFQILSPQGTILHDEPKLILDSDLSAMPIAAEEYGFWGHAQHSYDTHSLRIVPMHETGMKFQDVQNDLFYFKTKVPFRSYKDYVGCSGAPILDTHGHLVSLVVKGDKRNTGIFGVPLHTLRPMLDVELHQSQAAA